MAHAPLPTFQVPAVDMMPPVDEASFSVDEFVNYLLTQLLQGGKALLHSDFDVDHGQWRLQSRTVGSESKENIIAVTPRISRFRAVLAHFGMRFSGGLYGGFVEGFAIHRDVTRYVAIYTANDQLRGYWLKMYARGV